MPKTTVVSRKIVQAAGCHLPGPGFVISEEFDRDGQKTYGHATDSMSGKAFPDMQAAQAALDALNLAFPPGSRSPDHREKAAVLSSPDAHPGQKKSKRRP